MLSDFKEHIHSNFSFLKKSKVIVACSGGLDSVVLSHLLHNLGVEIALAHCNFSLRNKESDGDEEFVVNLADRLSVPIFIERFETKEFAKKTKQSTQMAARELRYAWFKELVENLGYDYVVTAHHADDDLETFFINLSRGSGLRGFTGIPAQNNNIIRPLLPFSREDILTYAKSNNYYWREDSSNASSEYLRNKMRHEVIPAYKETSSHVLKNLKSTQDHLTESLLLIEDYMALVYRLAITENFNGYSLHIEKLQELPNTEALLYELLHPFGFTDFQAISDLLEAQPGKQVLSKTHRLTKDRGVLLLTEKPSDLYTDTVMIPEGAKRIEDPVKLVFSEVDAVKKVNENSIYVDKQLLNFPLSLRKWRKGDVFQPFGMKGKKKLSKFFKDEKLSLVNKEKIFVLCSDTTIIWVIGLRADERFKVTTTTRQILKITALNA